MIWKIFALVFINGDAKLFAAFSAATGTFLHNPPLVIPDHANHCDKHRHDWPGRDASDQNEEGKLGDIIPACFCAQEFTA